MCAAARALLILAVALGAAPAAAWTPETRVRMVDEAIRLMPLSLRHALETYREDVLRGMLTPMTAEGQPAHVPPALSGTLDASLVAEADALVVALGERTPFSELARRFGALAHWVEDAGFPPNVGATGAERYGHFARFAESRRDKFPVVFYGHNCRVLDESGFAPWARSVIERARDDDAELARAYAAAGNPPHASAFDDRSVPFAIASLSYSNSITDIARVWLAAWGRAGGDVGRTPYLEKKDRAHP